MGGRRGLHLRAAGQAPPWEDTLKDTHLRMTGTPLGILPSPSTEKLRSFSTDTPPAITLPGDYLVITW